MIEIKLQLADITEQPVDAIVNAANEHLAHGGGVAGAISRKGGPIIQQQSYEWINKHGQVETGTAAITSAGHLKAKYVIHTVGPVMGSGNEDEKLASATKSAIELAEQHNLTTLAFPAISTGIFGYPVERCAKVMLSTIIEYKKEKSSIKNVTFCLFDNKSLNIFKTTLQSLRRN